MSDHISWDEYFMSIAILVSLRSKDPSSKVGAVLVQDNKILGTGYNGFPSGCDESRFPWDREVDSKGWINTKYPYVIHAEANALMNTVAERREAELYVTMHPCNECAKLLIQGGVRQVTYLSDKHHESEAFVAARKLLEVTGVVVKKMDPARLNIDLMVEQFKSYIE
jgi:dCMP deaminase